jgi:hypothetical protein
MNFRKNWFCKYLIINERIPLFLPSWQFFHSFSATTATKDGLVDRVALRLGSPAPAGTWRGTNLWAPG